MASQYAGEINRLYAEAKSGARNTSVPISYDNHTVLVDSLRLRVLQIAAVSSEPDDDFFNAGMNSLHVLNLRAAIRRGLSETKPQADQGAIRPKLIYKNPSLNLLSSAILQAINFERQNGHARMDTHERIYQALVDKYTTWKTIPPSGSSKTSHKGLTVLLTGSTGSLGSYVLDLLLADSRVSKVFSLNRGPDSETRQRGLNTSKGLSTKFEKATFLAANFAKTSLGLDEDVYQEMLRSVNQIIHNQWQVDFNLSLPSFEPQIAGVRNLCKFAASTSSHAPLTFTSSVATVFNWPSTSTIPNLVPEFSHANDLSLSTHGYGSSKLAAHKILEFAAQQWGVNVAILRFGQIAGPVSHGEHRMWSKQEWLASVLASSKHLGLLPDDMGGLINWVPVDYCAQVVLELADHTFDLAENDAKGGKGGVAYYHVVNPQNAEWSQLLHVVSLLEWVQALQP